MRTPLLLGVVLLAGCGLSPPAYCEQVASVTCERLFACTVGQAEREALESMFADVRVCTSSLQQRSRCATLSEQGLCGSRRWAPDNALKCIDELEVLPCDALATFRPTCASPCQ